jgi:NADPH-dependent 2,4-dienoyl-CoA reductase/sulfur reductase-like enzyme/rhodanese-related sulfurtransferase
VREIIIVGASAAGLRCACRLARLEPRSKITVLEARQTFSYAACGLPYVLSGDIAGAEPLLLTEYGLPRDADYFAGHKRVRVLAGHRVLSIDTDARRLKAVGPNGELELSWDELVLATGARPRRLDCQPEHPRVGSFHVLEDLEPLHQALSKGEISRVALVGAGPVGCELAEAFTSLWGAEVLLVEASPAPLPALLDLDIAATVAGHMRQQGVRLLLDSPVSAIDAGDDGVTITAGKESVQADAVVVAAGVEPAVELAVQIGATLGPHGAIAVDGSMATSVAGVWAIGDCVELRHAVTGEFAYLPLGSLANRQGRTLANILAGRDDAFPPPAGAIAVKVFDWNIAAVGSTERETAGRAVRMSSHDRAHYWPESKEIHLKLVYDPASRRVLGLQAAGQGEAVKRVDVAAPLIARGITIDELSHLEHAYAPPYAPAMEPLAVAAMVALNQEDGVESASPEEFASATATLDVRLRHEAEERPAPVANSTNIPLGELADRLEELDDSIELVLCERGTRSAEAARLLLSRGISSKYLSGGLRWLAAMRRQDSKS